jgi:hypothetical protein
VIAQLLIAAALAVIPVYVGVTPAEPGEDRNVLIYPFRDDDGDFYRDVGEASIGGVGTVTYPGGVVHFDAGHGVALIYVPPGHRVTVEGTALVPEWYECYPIQSIDPIPFSGSASIHLPCAPTTLGILIPMWVQRLLK